MSLVSNLFTIVFVSLGLVFFVAGVVGLIRLPDRLSRLHALSKADNLGLGLVILGLLPQATWPFGALKLIALWVLAVIGGSIGGQLLAATQCAAADRLEGQPDMSADQPTKRSLLRASSSDANAGVGANAVMDANANPLPSEVPRA